ncbi:Type III restriction enzyme [Candidatus Methylobacter favarea]|uniref:Type III restriction enzyme n=1 Tax=Candidatus Methylobacter favarea TaxID=2707345 RepID=A0A8S0X219_9GAMM|nr:DEAD/DEAH box helicase family protein [Candidatus Methylobacter favarea]CAA9891572.1 Type III restriction enzyme [Candidatus Methylobacter favarea]
MTTLRQGPQIDIFASQSELGIGNKLDLLDDELLENIRSIQLKNGLKQTGELASRDFTIEMETGTGKTYVYLRTIFELNQRFGFTKFIIVVPGVAIKEGVYKTLQITEQHFKEHYDNTPYDYFVYDSSKLGEVRSFATNDAIQIMVINIDAFRKSFTDPDKETSANIIHRPNDRMSGMKPIEFIRDTKPIVIIDEPQSVDTTAKSKEAVASLNPLCTIRYSATHKEKYNLMYKLDSIDAYERKLVKQIEVASIQVKDGHNKAYIKLLSVDHKKSPITAKIEFDKMQNGEVKRVVQTVKSGTDLLELSVGRDVYDGYVVNDIYCEPGNEYIDFTSKPEIIRLGALVGDVNPDEYKRLQIRKTIEEHLDKELKLTPKGIKVLSLFFIDKVANYRFYDEDGNPQKGKYALMFEEEYRQLIKKPKYNSLFKEVDTESLVEAVHDGYFSIDKSGKSKGQYKDTSGVTQLDEDTYQLIMRDKEKLLSFESKLKFIFSHSVLKEGWDNPNVFQICTLNETASVIKKRQEIGRGLRIAVNQDGERVHGFEVNTLTVMANESYEDFVSQLQREIEEEEGIKFGVVEKHLFANIVIETEDQKQAFLGAETSEKIWGYLFDAHYIDKNGKVQDKLRTDIKENKMDLPEDLQSYAALITAALKKVSGNLNIKNAGDKKLVALNKAVYLGEEFKQLWDRIKYKTTFRVEFDIDDLVNKCAEQIKNDLVVGKAKFVYGKGTAKIERGGITMDKIHESRHVYDAKDYALPDIVSYLQNETNLTRRTLVEILTQCGRLQDFKNNPQKFVDEVSAIIKSQMHHFIVDGIKYEKIGDEHFYAQELFQDKELVGYLNKNMLEAQKSVYDHVVYDSEVEAEFARSFEQSKDVKVYAKLPGWFKIETPLGNYNPDWAVLVDHEDGEKLYFVVETKGSILGKFLRPVEKAKIDCGREHFKVLGETVGFTVADSFGTFMDKVSG